MKLFHLNTKKKKIIPNSIKKIMQKRQRNVYFVEH